MSAIKFYLIVISLIFVAPVLADTTGKEATPKELATKNKSKSATDAAVSTKNLKQNMKLKELSDQNPGGGIQGRKGKMMGVDGHENKDQSNLGKSKTPESGTSKALKDAVGEQGPVTGAKYGDTYGGQRINAKHQGGKGNFKGGGGGNASSDSGMEDGDRTIIGVGPGKEDTGESREQFAKTVSDALAAHGKESSGNADKDTEELDYAQSVGTDHYAATKNMNEAQRKAYWEKEANKQKVGTPRDDDMGANGGPVGRQDVVTQGRGIAARKGAAGGKGDGRTDQQASGSGGKMIVRNKAEGAERETGAGTVNMDAVTKINQVVNPTRE